jgi:hypothetical protein
MRLRLLIDVITDDVPFWQQAAQDQPVVTALFPNGPDQTTPIVGRFVGATPVEAEEPQ